ncbi:hypothetical protein ABZY09_36140 [Streptomyces sp. NPDC002928]|uniref:MmyB family transcriptional regulator n=1 Tax=Streptomyces sp. NPDC002928 TaxID=3154440 RepID=UPI00339F1038
MGTPGLVLGRHLDVLAWNPLAEALLGDPASRPRRSAIWSPSCSGTPRPACSARAGRAWPASMWPCCAPPSRTTRTTRVPRRSSAN